MDPGSSRRWRWALVASAVLLTLVALTAIVAVIRGSFGEVEGKIVLSAVFLLAGTGLSMVGLDAWARGTAAVAGPVAPIASAVSVALWLEVIWVEAVDPPAWVPRTATIAAIVAAATALHAGLRTWARHPRWLVLTAIGLGYACGAEASVIVAREDAATAEVRGLAAGAIALVLALVLIPILARVLPRPEPRGPPARCGRAGRSPRPPRRSRG